MTDEERQQWLWEQLHPMFALDDGFLPDIFLEPITPADAGVIAAHLAAHGQLSAFKPWVWVDLAGQEHPLVDLAHTALMAAAGECEPISVLLVTVHIGPHAIPDLGVGIGSDCIWVDWRMGDGWTPTTVDAFFQLLARLVHDAPSQQVRVHNAGSEGQHVSPDHFQQTWTQFLALLPAAPPAASPTDPTSTTERESPL